MTVGPDTDQAPTRRLQTLLADVSAALVVSFLTIAAGSAFGLLTGLGAQAGILSMIVASLVAWVFGGQKVKVSGATGPTAGAMLAAITTLTAHGAGHEAAFAAATIAAGMLLIASFLPVGKLMSLVPNAATAVFVNGIALVILWKQADVMVGFWSSGGSSGAIQVGLALGTLALLVVWPKLWRPLTKSKIGQLVTGSLVAMILGGILVWTLDLQIETLDVVAIELSGLMRLTAEGFTAAPASVLLLVAAKMAVVIAFVTLATIRALAPGDLYSIELRNQSLGNLAVAAVGGVPATLGLVRIRILQNAGGQTAMAGIGTGLIVLLMLMFLPNALNQIPTSVFVGILIRAAWTSIDWRFFQQMRTDPSSNLGTFLIVATGSVAMLSLDHILVLITAILIWHIAQRFSAGRRSCPDIESCPFQHRLHDT